MAVERSADTAALQPIPASERSLAPDLARGGVLLFIALANVVGYLYNVTVGPGARPSDGSLLDRAADFAVSLFVDARSYPMFAMLFGYGMVQMARRSQRRGASWEQAKRLLLRRNLWLLVFGLVHAALLFAGDILGPYGATGLLVLVLFRRRGRDLVVTTAVTLVSLALIFGLTGAFTAGTTVTGVASYPLSALNRLGEWLTVTLVITLLAGLLGPMLIGVMVGRSGLLDRPWDAPARLRQLAAAGVATSVFGGLPFALTVARVIEVDSRLGLAALQGVHALAGIAGGFGYLCLFALFASRRPARTGVVGALAATGERSLTCYLLQSVVLAPVFSAWGLGWGDDVGTAVAYLVAAATWLVSVGVAVILARGGRRGPAEVVLRRLSYGRPAPVRVPARSEGSVNTAQES